MRLFASVMFLAMAANSAGPLSAAEPPSSGALGGRFSGAGLSHPLGGFSSSSQHRGNRTATVGTPYVYPYAYAWYVPNYYDPSAAAAAAAAPYVDAGAPVAPPPVIINQYFAPPQQADMGQQQQPVVDEAPPAAGAPLGPVDNYYLIAYKNRSVYPVISYWVEDKTLHYVTTGNMHNQASLDLIDLDKTKALNKSRDIPFSLPGQ